jgi:hypothetical protein
MIEIVFENTDHREVTLSCRHGTNTENFSLRLNEEAVVRPALSLHYAWNLNGNAITAKQLEKFGITVSQERRIVFGTPPGLIS